MIIKSTLRDSPIRAVIYAKDGVGKSTFCAAAPGAVFIASEDGLDNIDTQAVDPPKNWTELRQAVAFLTKSDGCKTIVIDTLDWIEPLCWEHVCSTIKDDKGRKVDEIEGYGYGKGYVHAVSAWRGLLSDLQQAGEVGKNVLLSAHCARKMVKNPIGEDYEQWQIKLNDRASSLIREWAHVVGFAEFDTSTATDKDEKRTKGVSTGKRILRTAPHAGYESKTRFTMPTKPIPLDWRSFAKAVAEGKPPSVEVLIGRLNAKLSQLQNPKITDACHAFVSERGRTMAAFLEAIDTVDGYLAEKTEQEKASS
jgi:hypothetical protein